MATLAFLEATINSEGATTFAEDNKSIIDFATREVDLLVEEESTYIAENIGEFIYDNHTETYESISAPIESTVTIATSAFGSIIADTSLSYSEQKEMIEGVAHMIAMGDAAIVEIVGPLTFGSTVGSMSTGTGMAGGAVAGGIAGGMVGSVSKLFSTERKAWKALVAEEKKLIDRGAGEVAIAKVRERKKKAKEIYSQVKLKATIKGAKIGAVVGGAGGAIAGGAVGGASASLIPATIVNVASGGAFNS